MKRSLRFLSWRLLQALPLGALVVVLNFFLLKSAPGDLADVIAGEAGAATPEYMAQLRAQFGTDQPLSEQFLHYLDKIAHFDLGWSYSLNDSVAHLIFSRLPATAVLMGSALFVAILIGTTLGVVAAVTRKRWLQNVISALATLGFAVPGFWLALMITVFFTIWLGWLPSGGMTDLASTNHGFRAFQDLLKHMAMPVACLAFGYLALYIRLMHDAVRDVALQGFVYGTCQRG